MDAQQLKKLFEDQIGPDKRFPTPAEMARFLGLPKTQASRLFNFLKGTDTQYMAVFEWMKALGIRLSATDEARPNSPGNPQIIDHPVVAAKVESLYWSHQNEIIMPDKPKRGEHFDYIRLALPDLNEKGQLRFEETPFWPINVGYLKKYGGENYDICMFFILGSYMEDALPDGSIIMVDLNQRKVASGHVYLVRNAHELMARRLEMRPTGIIIVKSDNEKEGKSFPVTPQMVEAGNFHIFGRMIFNCRVH